MDRKVSVVVSVYNEEKALEEFYRETGKVLNGLDWDYELVFVNDGSADGSLAILDSLAERDSRVKVVSFSRNFGHEAAMIAPSSVWTRTCSIRRNVFPGFWRKWPRATR